MLCLPRHAPRLPSFLTPRHPPPPPPPPQGRALAFGHYIADVRNGPGDSWVRYNDDFVSRVSPEATRSEAAEQDAYLLVFKSRRLWEWGDAGEKEPAGGGVLGKRGRDEKQGGEGGDGEAATKKAAAGAQRKSGGNGKSGEEPVDDVIFLE